MRVSIWKLFGTYLYIFSIIIFIAIWYSGLVTEQYKRKPNTKCGLCDNMVYRRPNILQQNGGRAFCSMVCYGLFCRKEVACVVCGKLILASQNKKTCSRACANKHRSGIKYKINSPNDKVKSQRALKIRLLENRGKKCERCDYSKYEILQVHHKDRNRKNNSVDNLELICPNCHFEEHFLEKSWMRDINKIEKLA